LIYPDAATSEIEESQKVPPLGLAYIASYMTENGYTVKILDLHTEKKSTKEIADIIRKEKPTIVGITCLTPFATKVKELAKLIKRTKPDIKIIVGGAHVTALPMNMLKDSNIDVAAIGEGELTFLELTEHYIKGKGDIESIKGICYIEDGQFRINPHREYIQNLDDLPFPARNLLPNDKYSIPHSNSRRITSILTMRGCPFNCNFCDYKFLMGAKLRVRSPKNVVDEIEECVKKYDITYFNFRDSTFALNENYVIGICKEILKRKLKIRWDCNGRANTVTEKMLKAMKKAGCVLVSYGIESGSQKILDFINKQTTVKQNYDAVRLTQKVGLNVLCYFMIGNPPDNKKTVEQTIDFAIKLNPDFALFGLTTPFPGTPLFEYCIKNKIIDLNQEDDYEFGSLYDNPIVLTKNLTKEELNEFMKNAYSRFYLRPRYILKKLYKIRSLQDAKKLLEGVNIFVSQLKN
jgi:radical SAM superfamily enzyme YgiQ (UPF0313 family)